MSVKKEKRLMILGKRLNALRGEMSQAEFAKKIGVTAATVGYYENSERLPDAETLRRICTACGVTSDYLIGLENAKTHVLASVSDQTGLSEMQIEALQEIDRQYKHRRNIKPKDRQDPFYNAHIALEYLLGKNELTIPGLFVLSYINLYFEAKGRPVYDPTFDLSDIENEDIFLAAITKALTIMKQHRKEVSANGAD